MGQQYKLRNLLTLNLYIMSIFSTTTVAPKRHVHELGFMNTISMQEFGVLYPILAKELVPGDVFEHKHAMNCFFMPQSSNVQHGFHLNTYYFFVPYRVVWPLWDKFIEDVEHGSATGYVKPYVQSRDLYNLGSRHQFWCHGSLADYLNMNSFDPSNTAVWDSSDNNRKDTLFFRAYQKIWVDHFIDQQCGNHVAFADLVNDTIIPSSGGESTSNFHALFNLRSKCWNKDVFTTALVNNTWGNAPTLSGTFDMSAFRVAAAMDKYRQIVARIGSRGKEWIRGIFGVTPPDYRLDMAEFITASMQPIMKNTIANHDASGGPDEDAQGFLASEFKSASVDGHFRFGTKEFGVLMGLACIVPDAVYFQGCNRQFLKTEPEDYFNPYFEHIGDQTALNEEIYGTVTTSVPTDTNKQSFGYVPRFAEYKYYDNEVHGFYRSAAYLDYHDAKVFSNVPVRSSTGFSQIYGVQKANGEYALQFPQDYANLKRIFNVSSGSPIAGLQFYHAFRSLRPMDKDSAVYIKG